VSDGNIDRKQRGVDLCLDRFGHLPILYAWRSRRTSARWFNYSLSLAQHGRQSTVFHIMHEAWLLW